MIVYDVTNEESIKNLEEWIREYENNNPCEFIISIVGNKVKNYLFDIQIIFTLKIFFLNIL